MTSIPRRAPEYRNHRQMRTQLPSYRTSISNVTFIYLQTTLFCFRGHYKDPRSRIPRPLTKKQSTNIISFLNRRPCINPVTPLLNLLQSLLSQINITPLLFPSIYKGCPCNICNTHSMITDPPITSRSRESVFQKVEDTNDFGAEYWTR